MGDWTIAPLRDEWAVVAMDKRLGTRGVRASPLVSDFVQIMWFNMVLIASSDGYRMGADGADSTDPGVIHDNLQMLDREQIPPEDVFSALQNDVRLGILRVLWSAPDPPVAYADLERRVPAESNNFNYHLGQLVGHFVRRTETGYELRHSGEEIIRAVIAGDITDDVSLGPIEIDASCPYCGSTVEIRYTDGLFTARCTDCAGVVRDPDLPRGTFMRYAFPPAGVFGRSPEELLEAAHVLYDSKIMPMLNGVCPECAGTVDHTLDYCADHRPDDDGICPACDGRFAVWTIHECDRCAYARQFVPWFKLLSEPPVIAFYHEHTDFDQSVPFSKLTARNAAYIESITQTIVSTDPLRILVEIPFENAELRATMDEDLELLDVEQLVGPDR